jgi:hypothetical protein
LEDAGRYDRKNRKGSIDSHEQTTALKMPPGLVATLLEKVGLSIYGSTFKRYPDDLHTTTHMGTRHV